MIYGIKIAGVGDHNGRYRYAEATPSGDSAGLYRAVLTQLPTVLMETDLLQDRVGIGGGQATLALPEVEGIELSLRESAEPEEAGLVVAASAGDVTLTVSGLDGTVVFWRREAILLGTGAPAGSDTLYSGCTRGFLDTRYRDILAQYPMFPVDTWDNAFFTRPFSLSGVRATFFQVPLDGGYDDEEVLFYFVLDDLGTVEGTDHVILRLSGALALLQEGAALPRRSQYQVAQAEGLQIDQQEFDIRWIMARSQSPDGVLDYHNEPASRPGYTAGQKILVKFEGSIFEAALSEGNGTGRHHATFDPRAPYRGWTPPVVLSSRTERLRTPVEEVLGSGYRGDFSTGPPSLGEDLLEVVMTLMTSTIEGDNGAFDKGFDLDGIDFSHFDIDDIILTRAKVGPLVPCSRYVLGVNDYVAAPLTEVQRLLGGAGLRLTYGPTGKIRIRPWEDDQPELDLSEFESFLTGSSKLDEVTDQIKVTYSPDGHFLDDTRWVQPVDVFRRQRSVRARKPIEANLAGIGDPRTAFALAMALQERAKSPMPLITCKVPVTEQVYPMQPVTLSGPGAFAKDGSEGLTLAYGRVVSVELDPDDHLKLVRVRLAGAYSGSIGPALAVDLGSYGSGAVVPTELTWFCGPYGEEDTDFFSEDDVLSVVDGDGTVFDSGLVILSVASGVVTLDRAPTVPAVAQWFLVSDDLGTVATSQSENWSYQERDAWVH